MLKKKYSIRDSGGTVGSVWGSIADRNMRCAIDRGAVVRLGGVDAIYGLISRPYLALSSVARGAPPE